MPKRRTTLVLENSTYSKLVEESLRKYGTSRSISKVVDSMVQESARSSKEQTILKLLYSKKIAKTTARDLEKDRMRLSKTI